MGLSGGRDSVVLLHALKQVKAGSISAVHVHHGLQPAADDFLEFCQNICKCWEIPFYFECIKVSGTEGLESNARKARYSALASYISDENTCLITAHHQLDQALTLLLQLGRGAGLAGLAAMPMLKAFSKGWHGRPLLQVSDEIFNKYARQEKLSWIEDPTNQEPVYLRNYFKQKLWPVLLTAVPGAEVSIVRSSQHIQSALAICEEVAIADLETLKLHNDSVLLDPLLQLSKHRQANVIRSWLKILNKKAPNTKRLEEFLRQLAILGQKENKDSRTSLKWAEGVLAYSRGRVYFIATKIPLEAPAVSRPPLLKGANDLSAEYLASLGIDLTKLTGPLSLKKRIGGEKYYSSKLNKKRSLKKYLQENNIPVWQRENSWLLFQGESLVAMLGVMVADDFKCTDLLESYPILAFEELCL